MVDLVYANSRIDYKIVTMRGATSNPKTLVTKRATFFL
jgi:hypothetical protein